MCTAGAALAMQGAGAASSAIGAYSGAQAQQGRLRTQAALDDLNAASANRSANSVLAAGQFATQQSMLHTAGVKGAQTAGFAASGVDLNSGSAARVLTSTDYIGQVDQNTIQANAVRSAWGYRTQAVNYQNDALMKRAGADATSPFMAGATSLLGSAGTVAGNWYQYNKAGALGGTPPKANDDWYTNPQAGP